MSRYKPGDQVTTRSAWLPNSVLTLVEYKGESRWTARDDQGRTWSIHELWVGPLGSEPVFGSVPRKDAP